MSEIKKYIATCIEDSINTKKLLLENKKILALVETVAEEITNAIKDGKKLILAGNGGSAADSQHIAAEFVSRFEFERNAMPAIALTTDTSALTAIGNDYGYNNVFSRQLSALGNNGDIFIGITTSGNSANILQCMEYCQKKGIKSILLTSEKAIDSYGFDFSIRIPSRDTARIQESHILIGHLLCGIVERNIFA